MTARRLANMIMLVAAVASLPYEAAAAAPAPAPVTGARDARVQILVVSDFECPFCARVVPTLQRILEVYPDEVQLAFVNQPLPFHKRARAAAIAALAAHRQQRFWDYHDTLFANQKALRPPDLLRYAAELGLDKQRFAADLARPELARQVERDRALATALGATGTPSFFVNGRKVRGAQPFSHFEGLIDEEISASKASGERGQGWLRARTKANNKTLYDYFFAGMPPPALPAPPAPSAPPPPTVEATVYRVEVNPDDPSLGSPNAPVTMVVFSEFQCPYCRKLHAAVATLVKRYGDTLRVVHKHHPLPFHRRAEPAARASVCAHAQGRFWQMAATLFDNQAQLADADLARYALSVGLDVAAFERCLDDPRTRRVIERDKDQAVSVTATGTPATYINGRKLLGSRPIQEFEALIDEELTKAKRLLAEGTPAETLYETIIAKGRVLEPLGATVHRFSTDASPRLGSRDAKVEVVVFSDFQCPFCARVNQPLREVQAHYGKDASVVFKHFPLSFHREARPAARAAICAQRQKRFWPMHDAILAGQQALGVDGMTDYGRVAGLDVAKLEECLARPATLDAIIDADIAEARAADVRGTPTVFINGRQYDSPAGYTRRALVRAIDQHVLKPSAP